MSERNLQIGTAEIPYELDDTELVIGVMVILQTADINDPHATTSQICVPDEQDFMKTLGLARYGQLRTDARVGEATEDD